MTDQRPGREDRPAADGNPPETARKQALDAFDAYVAGLPPRRPRARRLPPGLLSLVVIIVVGAGFWALSARVGDPLRPEGAGPQPSRPAAQAGLAAPRVTATPAGVRVAWNPMAGAEAYVVTVLEEDLVETHRTAPAAATAVDIGAAQLPVPPAGGFVRVTALVAGIEVETSAMVMLPADR